LWDIFSDRQVSTSVPTRGKIEKIPMPAKSADSSKENKSVKVNKGHAKVLPDSSSDLKIYSLPRPLASQPRPLASQPRPLASQPNSTFRSSPKKVSLSDIVEIIEPEKEPLEQSNVVNSSQSGNGTETAEVPRVKGHPKGRKTFHNVVEVDMDKPPECKTQ
jgi:hypothetical protein